MIRRNSAFILTICSTCLGAFAYTAWWNPAWTLLFPVIAWAVFYEMRKAGQKRQKQWKQEQDLLLNALREGVILLNEEFKVEFINFMGAHFLGISKKLLEGHSFGEQRKSVIFNKTFELILSSQRLRAPLTDSVILEGDKKIHLDLMVIPRMQGKASQLKGFFVIFQDTSSDHKMLEVGKDFIASASHELKTPITIIRGFAETLQDMKNLPQEMMDDILEKIVRNCHRMDNLVKNLLTLADIENIPLMNTQYCDLEALLQECKRVVLSIYPQALIEIEKPSGSITAEVDPGLLELAVLNLLGNAVKYSSSPARVTISMNQNPDEVQISIRDQGMGISPEDLEHIFDRFYTVNKAHSRKLGGAGIGLSLVKTIVEKHEGIIQVTSTLGKGSTFTVCLPRCHH
jgi:two-component system phosphate regulon sensor histidine kinase PhoR